jgi:mannose-1-phosphate guanylyltransferase / phosphomannomutase
MKAMLLAAGRGERLRPLTDTVPKAMLHFEGKPLLEHWIDKLRASGICDIIINLHHLGHIIAEYFGSGERWGVHIEYSQEAELLGTAGAVRKKEREFRDGPFLVIYADNQSTCSLSEIVKFHEERASVATMSVCLIADPRSCGIVGFDARGRIERFLEKPTTQEIFSHYINAGIYVFNPAVFDYCLEGGNSDFSRDVFPNMLQAGAPLYAYSYDGYVLKFDTFEDWKLSQDIVEAEKKRGVSAGFASPVTPAV